jgi:hypothetical protein
MGLKDLSRHLGFDIHIHQGRQTAEGLDVERNVLLNGYSRLNRPRWHHRRFFFPGATITGDQKDRQKDPAPGGRNSCVKGMHFKISYL